MFRNLKLDVISIDVDYDDFNNVNNLGIPSHTLAWSGASARGPHWVNFVQKPLEYQQNKFSLKFCPD